MEQTNLLDLCKDTSESSPSLHGLSTALGSINLDVELLGLGGPSTCPDQMVQNMQKQEREEFKRGVKWAQRELTRMERLDAEFRASQKEVLELHIKLAREEVELEERLFKIELEEERKWLEEDVAEGEKQIEELQRVELEQFRERERQIEAEVEKVLGEIKGN